MLSSLNCQLLAYLALVYLLLLSTNVANALPLRVRQNGATTVQTVHTTQTLAGQLTETCVITLTPITDKSGQPAVEEVKKCSLSYNNLGDGSGGGDGSPNLTTSSTTFTAVSTAGNTAATSSFTADASGASTSTTFSSAAATSTSAFSTGASVGTSTASGTSTGSLTSTSTLSSQTSTASVSGLVVNGISTVTGIPNQTATPTTTTSATDAGTAVDASASPPGATAAAAEQPSDSAAFQLPGKKLSVLPIGLGVFAGISVIALIVVGLVTYERTKYRKAFRARKLAESGATMGYGGMAQRP